MCLRDEVKKIRAGTCGGQDGKVRRAQLPDMQLRKDHAA